MFKTILVPTDGSALSEKAVSTAVQFASENGSEVVALSVAQPYVYSVFEDGASIVIPAEADAFDQRVHALAMQYVDKVKTAASEREVRCKTVVAQSHLPHEEIIKAAEQFRCDVIFMASHGRKALGSLLIGSETQKVLAHSTVPVLVLR
jgi:nucleotide-binding universal stress UspA family protein